MINSVKEKIVNICMVTDRNFLIPTRTAIFSIIKSKEEKSIYSFYIIVHNLTNEEEGKLKEFEKTDVKIHILRAEKIDVIETLHHDDGMGICAANNTALLKFLIPEMLIDIEKVIYIDGDIIAKKSLDDLYNTDITDYYAAVAAESGCIYYKHEIAQKVEKYFNSGVMLLNLSKLRREEIAEKLINRKNDLVDYLMDQNVFNIEFEGKVRYLPIRYNFLAVNLENAYGKWSIEDINKLYGTKYRNEKELYDDAVLIHFSSKKKPWQYDDVPFGFEWKSINYQLNGLYRETQYDYTISVIIPCFNVEEYIVHTIKSIIMQRIDSVEIICIDDGSTDATYLRLTELSEQYPNMVVIHDSNHGQGYQRNRGLEKARGKYVFFMDSDDFIDENCFSRSLELLEANGADACYFEAYTFFETSKLEEEKSIYRNLYRRNKWYPHVFSGKEIYVKMRQSGDYFVSPCLSIIRRETIIDKGIRFPEIKRLEDNLFSFRLINSMTKVICIPDILYSRRVRNGSTMTINCDSRLVDECDALKETISLMYREYSLLDKEDITRECVANHIKGYCEQFNDVYCELDAEKKAEYLSSADMLGETVVFLSDYVARTEKSIRYYRKKIREMEISARNNDEIKQAEKYKKEWEIKIQKEKEHNKEAISKGFSSMEEYYLFCLTETRKSFSYRIGLIITAFPRWIRSLFKNRTEV